MLDVHYQVNEEKGICTCIINVDEWDAINEYGRRFETYPIGLSFNYDSKKFYMHNKFVGVAKCAPEDEFIVEVGQDLAFDKAYKKYLKEKKRILLEISDFLVSHVKVVSDFVKYESKKYKKVPPYFEKG